MTENSRRVSAAADRASRSLAHAGIRVYQLSLSAFFGGHCRHLPTCSVYTDEAIRRHGVWAGGWMGAARLWRCRPWGTSGYDPVPLRLPDGAGAATPWRYGLWRGPLVCEPADDPAVPPKEAK